MTVVGCRTAWLQFNMTVVTVGNVSFGYISFSYLSYWYLKQFIVEIHIFC